jgi:hypothetical protein
MNKTKLTVMSAELIILSLPDGEPVSAAPDFRVFPQFGHFPEVSLTIFLQPGQVTIAIVASPLSHS